MAMHLVERMTMMPGTCMICGSGNVPYEDGEKDRIGPFIDLGIDYGWGDSAYMCLRPSCAARIAVLAGFVAPDKVKDFEREIARLRKELHDAKADREIRARHSRRKAVA
jgi:hypothetical protein